MDKKKKIIIISVCVVIALIIIGVAIYFISRSVTEAENENRLAKMYDRMMENETYRINFKLDDNNQYTVSRKGNMANVDTYRNGTHTTDIVRDGDTILLMYSTNKYYTYQNNELELTELSNQLDQIIQSQEPEKGREKIDGKTYRYEEYKNVSYFLINTQNLVSEENTNTRFYFDGDDLKYIKTIMGEETELIQVDTSYQVNDSVFEIPADFEEG